MIELPIHDFTNSFARMVNKKINDMFPDIFLKGNSNIPFLKDAFLNTCIFMVLLRPPTE